MRTEVKIALAGNPNSGKTTLFNEITGSRQHVGNYPGVTVEKKEGKYKFNGYEMLITDLPGTYSLTAYSEEEVVARDFMVNEKPRVVINIVDASNLERNLYLSLQFLELGIPICIALNMIDVANSRGLTINSKKLSKILGVPVIPTIARTGEGKEDIILKAANMIDNNEKNKPLEITYGNDIDEALMKLIDIIENNKFLNETYPSKWVALKYLENDEQILEKGKKLNYKVHIELKEIVRKLSDHLKVTLDTYPEALIADHRYGYINSIIKEGVLEEKHEKDRLYASDKIDKVLTNRFFGPIIMFAIILALYKFTFSYSEIPVGWFENFFGFLSDFVSKNMSDGYLKSMIVSGVIDGVGGVLGFVPIILFMFLGISFLEDSGYLARAAYMLDRVFKMFGLHGSSVMPYIISGGIAGGCGVPGIMATRTLKSPKEKLATLLTVPFMNCGAKLPVLALLIATFFQDKKSELMFVFTLIAWVGALLIAKLLRMTIIKGRPTPFVMELPPYRVPTLKGLLIHTWERTWQYIRKAGTVILALSIILWAMMTFPKLDNAKVQEFNNLKEQAKSKYSVKIIKEVEEAKEDKLSENALNLKEQLEKIDALLAEAELRNSIAGKIGTSLESISKYAGFDWRINIALVGGFAAKEIVVSTLGTAYSLGEVDVEESENLAKTLAKSKTFSPIIALSLIIFTIFYAPCFVAVVCIVKEAGSWKWGLFSMVFNTALAFVLAVLVYQVGTYFNLLSI